MTPLNRRAVLRLFIPAAGVALIAARQTSPASVSAPTSAPAAPPTTLPKPTSPVQPSNAAAVTGAPTSATTAAAGVDRAAQRDSYRLAWVRPQLTLPPRPRDSRAPAAPCAWATWAICRTWTVRLPFTCGTA
jgi:hypothetical protein